MPSPGHPRFPANNRTLLSYPINIHILKEQSGEMYIMKWNSVYGSRTIRITSRSQMNDMISFVWFAVLYPVLYKLTQQRAIVTDKQRLTGSWSGSPYAQSHVQPSCAPNLERCNSPCVIMVLNMPQTRGEEIVGELAICLTHSSTQCFIPLCNGAVYCLNM